MKNKTATIIKKDLGTELHKVFGLPLDFKILNLKEIKIWIKDEYDIAFFINKKDKKLIGFKVP